MWNQLALKTWVSVTFLPVAGSTARSTPDEPYTPSVTAAKSPPHSPPYLGTPLIPPTVVAVRQ